MRILAVGLLYPPHYVGGYELIWDGVMRAARARGHDIQIVTSDYQARGAGESDDLPIDRSLRPYFDMAAQRAVKLGPRQRLRQERANGAVLESHLKKFAPDVVNWWGMGGMSLSMIERVRRMGLPSVLVIQDSWLIYGYEVDGWTRMAGRLRPLARILEPLFGVPVRYELERSGRFLFNSESSLQAVLGSGLEPADSVVLSPGVHSRYLAIAPEKDWEWHLLYVGRVDSAKGVDITIAALAHLPPQSTLAIVGAGDGAYEAELRSRAQSLGVADRVDFLGRVDAGTLPSIYAAADVVLFPIRWDEPWGLVPLEAMGIGRPVVATAKGGAVTYLRDAENALVIPPEDPQALAASVRRLAGDEPLRARLRAGGARTAAMHSASRYEQRVVDELERAAAGESGAWVPEEARK
jgi:glycosyltransferase involved in cell wall biosynthesis